MSLDPPPAGERALGATAVTAVIPVVGLGGSAGALTPFETFFKSMPADSGAAFVVIQHMSPSQQSLLPELLGQHTGMLVVQARDGLPVEPNCVYIIPPDHYVGLRNGALFLADRIPEHGVQLPIDFFFRSLAEDRDRRAIGVLFSGAGSDGSLGARAIRGAGGIVIAQEPRSAQFGDLPRNAVAAGQVDYVLPPHLMPEVVVQYLQHPYVRSPEPARAVDARSKPEEVQEVLALVRDLIGSDFRCYKPATILRRIGRRMGLLNISDLNRYVALLRRDPDEIRRLHREFLINVTEFFRDPEAFAEVRDRAIAPLAEARSGTEPLRIWVPACATGEEAYSLAMLALEERAKAGKSFPIQVFATDLSEEALEVARRGFYPESIANDVGPERLLRFFVRLEKGYQVKESLREVLTIAAQDVLADPPFSKMDIISCRNLLIYLDSDAQAKLMALFNFALKPGGYLFLGKSEAVAGLNDLFEASSKKTRLYRRLTPVRPLLLDSPIMPGRRRAIPLAPETNWPATSNFADVVRLEILRHFGAGVILVDRKGEVLQFHGAADRYLSLPAPGPSFNVFNLARGRLGPKLRLAMHKALLEGKTEILERVPVSRGDGDAFARVTVTPVSQRALAAPLLVVFFEDVAGPSAGEAAQSAALGDESLIARLEDELRETQHDLQSTIEELQSSNEQLRAANEEVTSTNEELESTNEELTTSTEELRSTNEELTATVAELQEKVELLDRANNDITRLARAEKRLAAIVESSGDAIFAKSLDGFILTWNQAARRMYGYSAEEAVGRSVGILIPPEREKERAEIMQRIGRGESIVDVETQRLTKDGRRIDVSLSVSPIRDAAGRVVGASAIARDITERKRAEEALRRSEERFRALVESSPSAVLLVAADGKIGLLNREAETMFGYTRDELIGQVVEVLVPKHLRKRHRSHRARFVSRPQRRPMGTGRELLAVRKDGSEFPVEIGLTPLEMPEGLATLATVTDITGRTRRRDT